VDQRSTNANIRGSFLARFRSNHPILSATLLLLAVQGIISIGLWRGGAPLTEEGVHILRSYSINSSPKTWTNLFHVFYRLLLWIIDDPVDAHLVYRFIVAQSSVIVLWRILRAFGLSWNAATLSCLFWIGFGLANPIVQSSNTNLFCFSIAGYGLSLILERMSWMRMLSCAILWLVAAGTRPEYALPLVLLLVYWGWLLLGSMKWYFKAIITAAVATVFVAAASLFDLRSINSYLTISLWQCYAWQYARSHPGLEIEVFNEYKTVIDSVFGHPRTFLETIANNPFEIFRYVCINSSRNLVLLLPGLASNVRGMIASPRNPYTIISLVATLGLLTTGSWLAYRKSKILIKSWRPLVLLGVFGSGSAVAVLILLPGSRYWMELVPFIYIWLGIALEAVLFAVSRGARIAALLIGAVGLLWPMPWEKGNNREPINMVSRSLAGMADPVIGASFPEPWVAFGLRGRGKGVYLLQKANETTADSPYVLESSGTDDCLRQTCDLVVINKDVRASRAWREHSASFALLQPQAEVFDLIYTTSNLDFYLRKKPQAHPEPAPVSWTPPI